MAEQNRKRSQFELSRDCPVDKIMKMEGVSDNIIIKSEPVSPTKAKVEDENNVQDATLKIKTEIKMEPIDESNFQIKNESNMEANEHIVQTGIAEAEPMQVFVKGVYLTKERTKWMEVHHDVKKPRTIKTIKVAGYTCYREKYQEVHFDLKRWNELFAQKDIILDYLSEDDYVFKVPKVKLSGNLKIEFKSERIGKFVTFSQSRNSVSMKGLTLSYMLKYNEWVQECLAVKKFDFQN